MAMRGRELNHPMSALPAADRGTIHYAPSAPKTPSLLLPSSLFKKSLTHCAAGKAARCPLRTWPRHCSAALVWRGQGQRPWGEASWKAAPRLPGVRRARSGLTRGHTAEESRSTALGWEAGSTPDGSYKLGISRDLIHFTHNKITTFQRGKPL